MIKPFCSLDALTFQHPPSSPPARPSPLRSQAMIKLYVIVSIVEMFDRLISSFGQDVLDTLYWSVRTRPRSLRLLYEPWIALAYVLAHATLFFVHVATINVSAPPPPGRAHAFARLTGAHMRRIRRIRDEGA